MQWACARPSAVVTPHAVNRSSVSLNQTFHVLHATCSVTEDNVAPSCVHPMVSQGEDTHWPQSGFTDVLTQLWSPSQGQAEGSPVLTSGTHVLDRPVHATLHHGPRFHSPDTPPASRNSRQVRKAPHNQTFPAAARTLPQALLALVVSPPSTAHPWLVGAASPLPLLSPLPAPPPPPGCLPAPPQRQAMGSCGV